MSILNRFKAGKYKSTQASSFWLDDDFDVEFKSEAGIDYTKLAAAQRAIGNFVNIVTGKPIPVVFQSNDSSYTDGQTVTIGTKLDGKNFDPAVGLALHEGSHIALTDFTLFKRADGYSSSYLAGTVFGDIVKQNITPDNVMDARMLDNQDYALIKDLLNWIEDRRIDFHIYTTAPGYRNYYEAMYNQYFNDKVIDKALVAGEKCDELRDDYMFHIINFTNANRKLDALTELRSIWNLIDIKNISRLKSTTDALLLACQVYKIIDKATAVAEQAKKDAETAEILNKANMGGDASTEDEDGDGSGGDGSEENDNTDETDTNGGSDIDPDALTDKELEKLQKAIDKQREFINGDSKKTGRITKTQAATVNALRESGTEVAVTKRNTFRQTIRPQITSTR
jgi:hypothetical protein